MASAMARASVLRAQHLHNSNGSEGDGEGSDHSAGSPGIALDAQSAWFKSKWRPQRRGEARTKRSATQTTINDYVYDSEPSRRDDRVLPRQPMLRIDPRFPQDVTVHMSLPVQDDLEGQLEDCSRLRRLGHFTEAITLFRERLDHFFDNRYVLVQYAQCLYEAGQHAELLKLAEERAPPRVEPPDALQLNWDMLVLAAGGRSLERALPEDHELVMAVRAVLKHAWPRLDSTECQLLALLLEFEIDVEKVVPADRLANLAGLYAHLIDHDMVWEFRDVVQVHLVLSAPNEVLDLAIPEPHPLSPFKPAAPHSSVVKRLREQWGKAVEDESTLFALLDVFTTLALQGRDMGGSRSATLEHIKDCMAAADECGSALRSLDEANLTTRPCLQWIMAKQMVKDNKKLLFYDQTVPQSCAAGHGKPGFRFTRGTFPSGGLPIYDDWTGSGSIPHWKPRPVPPGSEFATIANAVSETAKALGDLELQTACLKEMLYRGVQPPEMILSTLRGIWMSTGNKRELLRLNIFRALLAHTPSAREALERELLLEIGTGSDSQLIYRLHTLAALTMDSGKQDRYREMAETVEFGPSWRRPPRFSGHGRYRALTRDDQDGISAPRGSEYSSTGSLIHFPGSTSSSHGPHESKSPGSLDSDGEARVRPGLDTSTLKEALSISAHWAQGVSNETGGKAEGYSSRAPQHKAKVEDDVKLKTPDVGDRDEEEEELVLVRDKDVRSTSVDSRGDRVRKPSLLLAQKLSRP